MRRGRVNARAPTVRVNWRWQLTHSKKGRWRKIKKVGEGIWKKTGPTWTLAIHSGRTVHYLVYRFVNISRVSTWNQSTCSAPAPPRPETKHTHVAKVCEFLSRLTSNLYFVLLYLFSLILFTELCAQLQEKPIKIVTTSFISVVSFLRMSTAHYM